MTPSQKPASPKAPLSGSLPQENADNPQAQREKAGALNVSVLILFFNRAESLKQVFEAVREARPARLFLYQDGPRGEQDLPGIYACREVVKKVDWPCEVHRNFQTRNFGCDPSGFLAQRWAFSLSEKCIVLEDDVVPSKGFFLFCQEMLDKYEHDERIGMIAGFNTDEQTTDVGEDSYFFTTNFSIWGWASWARVVNHWDESYQWLENPHARAKIKALTRERRLRADFLPMAKAHKGAGKPFFETIFQAFLLLHGQMSILPRVNMINNIGVTDRSTHFCGSIRTLPRAYRKIFTMKRYDLALPLHHPTEIIDHVAYRKRTYRVMGWRCPWRKAARSVEEFLLNLRYGQFSRIGSALKNRLHILFFGRKFH